MIKIAIIAAAAYAGGYFAGELAGGALSGAIIGASAGGLVGGLGFEAFGVGSFKEGFIAGGIAGGLAGFSEGRAIELSKNPASVEVVSEQNPLKCFAQTVYSLGVTLGSLFTGKSPKYPNMVGSDVQGNQMNYSKCRANGGGSGVCSYSCDNVAPGI